MNIASLTAKAEGEIPDFLRKLGYEVDWDFRDGLGRWYEVYDGERLVFQIDDWTPLKELLADLPGMVEKGRHSTKAEITASQWQMRTPRLKDARELLRRVRAQETR